MVSADFNDSGCIFRMVDVVLTRWFWVICSVYIITDQALNLIKKRKKFGESSFYRNIAMKWG